MKFLALAVSCLVFVGCKNPTKEFESLADRACACAEDASCGKKVLADLAAFSDANKTDGNAAWIKAGVRLNDCLISTGVQQRELTAALEKISK